MRRTTGARWSSSGGRGWARGRGWGGGAGGAQPAAGIHGVVSADGSGKNGRGTGLRLCASERSFLFDFACSVWGQTTVLGQNEGSPAVETMGNSGWRKLSPLQWAPRPSERLSLVNWKAELRPCRRVAGSGGNQGGRRRGYLLKKKKEFILEKPHTVKEPHDMEQITRHTHKEQR